MSLVKIAKAKKRRYADGGSEGDSQAGGNGAQAGPAGPSIGGSADGFSGTAGSDTSGSIGAPATGGDSQAGGNGAQQGPAGPSIGGSTDGFTGSDAPGVTTGTPSVSPNAPEPGSFAAQLAEMLTGGGSKLSGLPGTLGVLGGLANLAGKGINAAYDNNRGGTNSNATANGTDTRGDYPAGDPSATPFGDATPAQTTPAPDTGARKYVWDPVLRQYTLTSVGAGENPMGYTAGQTFRMAAGGAAPSGIAAGAPTQARFVQGGGTGLSDSVPVKMDDGGEGRLADGEFVFPADVVSGLGGGSSKAGADILYQMMERIRQQAHGSSKQINPVDPQQVMPA